MMKKIFNLVFRPRPAYAALGLMVAMALSASGNPASAQEIKLDPANVAGPDACGECHKSSVAVWKKTRHAITFKELPRKKEAKKIAKNLGIRRMKANSACLSCHFTSAEVKGKVKPIAGITCESCHGAGKNWIKEHGDYGGKGVTMESETPDHKKARYAKSEAAGMIRPVRLYKVAANCYGCHTVPNEKLVNVGGHPAGSKFDLVAWSQGEVRHNVWYSKPNDEASAARKRMMYIVGKALDLEFALRGIAKATQKATYAVSMAKRAAAARKAMKKIAGAVKTPEIEAIVAAAGAVKLKLNNAANLTAAADKISAAAEKFSGAHDGSKFAAVDALVPGADKYQGKPAP